ncbi:RhuM family protein [Iodobacter sp. LRB]|uniref:RhuM family protein n=1 Tax=unclassified Iodobacter TaxID=235634 RepID=UPI000C101B44|nr:RhuM family protein [Iodobacter sp. BJB302]PHU99790.1 hypothetical protein CSQ88_20645 [Iodobacter sp. BJB302]
MSHWEIYPFGEEGSAIIVRLKGDSLWLSQAQLATLFGCSLPTIAEHLLQVFNEGELIEEMVSRPFLPCTDKEESDSLTLYNLDAILSVGYRINTKQSTVFRQWATKMLNEHFAQKWAVDKAQLEQNLHELEIAFAAAKDAVQLTSPSLNTMQNSAAIISRYRHTFRLLQRYDEGVLLEPVGTSGGCLSSLSEVRHALAGLKDALMIRGEACELFGCEHGCRLATILEHIDQTIVGNPTIESKAAHLLYFVIKETPLSEGNKRAGAFLFIDFLHRNNALMLDGEPIINDVGLAALALLIAQSTPMQKESMICLIENMLAKPTHSLF